MIVIYPTPDYPLIFENALLLEMVDAAYATPPVSPFLAFVSLDDSFEKVYS